MKYNNKFIAATVGGVSLASSLSIQADSLALEEVVVTAQKREQSLQDVGISITAFSGDQLEKLNFNTASQVTAMAPNVESRNVYGGRGINTLFFIRGIGQTDFNDGTESPVNAYVDEFYLINPGTVDFLLMDIDRAEVLRGPQGTLFGRNATGGAIQYITRRPSNELEAFAEVDVGNYDHFGLEGYLNVPLGERAAFRLSASSEEHDPFVDNINPTGDDLQEGDFQSLRGQLLFDPTDDLSILLKVEQGEAKGVLGGDQHMATQAVPGGVIAAETDAFGYSEALAGVEGGDKTNANGYNYVDNSSDHILLRAEWVTDAFTLTSVTGYLDQEKDIYEDCDGGPLTVCSIRILFASEHFTQELRLNGSTDTFDWTAGVYYLQQDSDAIQDAGALMGAASPALAALGAPPDIFDGLIFDVDWTQEVDSYALFGQFEYHFSEQWTGIVGIRATRDEKKFEMTKYDFLTITDVINPQPGDWGTFPSVAPVGELVFTNANAGDLTEQDADQYTGNLQLNWTPHDDLLVYGSFRRGVKSGGFNNGFINIGPLERVPYDEEVLHAWELGYKWTIASGLARLNGAFFYYDYQDYQASFFEELGLFITNAEATMQGGEIELAASPVEGLDIVLGASVLDSEAKDIPNLGVVKDRDMGNAPDFTANGVVRYAWSALGGELALQASATYTSERYTDVLNSPVLELDDYTQVDANATYTSGDGRWRVMAYTTNLTDEEVATQLFELSTLGGVGQQNYLPPRQYGMKFSYSWY